MLFIHNLAQVYRAGHRTAPGDLISVEMGERQRADSSSADTEIIASPGCAKASTTCRTTTASTSSASATSARRCPRLRARCASSHEQFRSPRDALEVDPSCVGAANFGHGGKFGFTPWIDIRRGYYAVVSVNEENKKGGDDGQRLPRPRARDTLQDARPSQRRPQPRARPAAHRKPVREPPQPARAQVQGDRPRP